MADGGSVSYSKQWVIKPTRVAHFFAAGQRLNSLSECLAQGLSVFRRSLRLGV